MNKVDFARRLATRLQLSNYESIEYLNAVIKELEIVLSEGEPIIFQQFGTFAPWYQPTRPGRNPRNGDPYTIPARTSVKFRPGKGLLDKLNGHLLGLLFAVLFTLCGSSCTAELPATDAQDEWLPFEINSGVAGMTIASFGTRAETVTLPDCVKTAFEDGDEIKLTIAKSDGTENVTLIRSNGKWLEKTSSGNKEFKRKKNYINCTVTAECGTAMTDEIGMGPIGQNVSTTGYLKTEKAATIALSNKTLTCTLNFEYQYPCIKIEVLGDKTSREVFFMFGSYVVRLRKNVFSGAFANIKDKSNDEINVNFDGDLYSTTFECPAVTFKKNKLYLFKIYTPEIIN